MLCQINRGYIVKLCIVGWPCYRHIFPEKNGLGTHHNVFHRFHHIRDFYNVASLDTSTKVNNISQIALVQVAFSHSPVVNPKAVSRDQNIAVQSSKPAELALQKLQKYGNHGKRQKPWTISLQFYNKTHNKCMSCRLQSWCSRYIIVICCDEWW